MRNTPASAEDQTFFRWIVGIVMDSANAVNLLKTFEHVCGHKKGLMAERHYADIAFVLLARRPCRLLIFGAGVDSELWAACNDGGETLILEDVPRWRKRVAERVGVSVRAIAYDTTVSRGLDFTQMPRTSLDGSFDFTADVVIVDGPRGYQPSDPGRMGSIELGARSLNQDGLIFVHDTDRALEQACCEAFCGPRVFHSPGSKRRPRHLSAFTKRP